jgi:DNA repair protein RadA/Sms
VGAARGLVSPRLPLPLPPDAAACGEIGLGGEVRRVGRTDLRVREAVRLGFRRVLVPDSVAPAALPGGAQSVPVAGVADAVAWLRRNAAPPPENAR